MAATPDVPNIRKSAPPAGNSPPGRRPLRARRAREGRLVMPRYRFCHRHGVVPDSHRCGRWQHGSTRQWRNQRAAVLDAQPTCTHPGCDAPSTEVHHIDDQHVRAVCFKHNPRGPVF